MFVYFTFVLSHIPWTACKMSTFIKLDITSLRNGQFVSFFFHNEQERVLVEDMPKLLSIICLFLKTSHITVNFFLTHPVVYINILPDHIFDKCGFQCLIVITDAIP